MVLVHDAVLELITAEADALKPLETGGVLLGFFQQPENVPIVLLATRPGPNAMHRRGYYRPDYEHDEMQIADLYKQSGGQLVYLGDWHTHPLPRCRMSHRDRNTLRRIAAFKPARVDEPIMLIHCADGGWTPNVWQGRFYKRGFWRRKFVVQRREVRVVK